MPAREDKCPISEQQMISSITRQHFGTHTSLHTRRDVYQAALGKHEVHIPQYLELPMAETSDHLQRVNKKVGSTPKGATD